MWASALPIISTYVEIIRRLSTEFRDDGLSLCMRNLDMNFARSKLGFGLELPSVAARNHPPRAWLTAIVVASLVATFEMPAAERSSGDMPKPARVARPRRDPVDQLFRNAPMAEASRSVVIPLATNLHLAFDSELLRAHTVWSGDGLNLFGPPYHGGKTPFICAFDGATLWTTPPVPAWSVSSSAADVATRLPTRLRFKGLKTEHGTVTLNYELRADRQQVIEVRETPRAVWNQHRPAIVRRFDLSPSSEGLFYLAHAEMGADRTDREMLSSTMIQRTNDVLLTVVRGWTNIQWAVTSQETAYEVPIHVEKRDGESAIEKRNVAGFETRAFLFIPAHAEPIRFELASFICRDLSEAARLDAELRKLPLSPLFNQTTTREQTHPLARQPQTFSADNGSPRRVSGDDYYRVEHFPLPREIALMVTGMDWLPNGDLAVCTWSGEIWIVEQAQGPVESARYRRFARGLNEPLGLKVVRNQIYVVQKPELTRIADSDGNGEGDHFETLNNSWGYTGNYHAFAFGPVIDRANNFYAFFCGQRGRWEIPYVGWCVTITPDGRRLDGFCSGLRAPNGFGTYGPDDELFVADNQGNWVGASKLSHLERGKFYGFPSGFPAPEAEYKQPKSFTPPAVWFPRKLSPSTSGFVTVDDDRFGPFKRQMLIGDFQNAVVLRVFLEKVGGRWQGAVWPFAKGFLSGVNRLAMGPDGKLYVGGLKNSAWPAAGPKEYSLDRVAFAQKVPFEIKEARATNRGFELTFTEAVDKTTATNPDNYDVAQFTYLYHQTYGSPEIDHEGKKESSTPVKVAKATVSNDGRIVRLDLDGWKTGYVTVVRTLDVQSARGQQLWHDTFYYTLNHLPE